MDPWMEKWFSRTYSTTPWDKRKENIHCHIKIPTLKKRMILFYLFINVINIIELSVSELSRG